MRHVLNTLQVMDVYKRLYALMRDINQAVSSLVFGTVLNALVHFSKLLLIILDSDVFMAQVATFIESAWVFLLLVCAAEGEENVGQKYTCADGHPK